MKSAILITGRLKSTRLPMKAIKKIHGQPMFKHLVDRLKLSESISDIILITSVNAQDNQLCEIAQDEGIEYYRGDPDDVLARMLAAADLFNIDTVISCTADNPFVDPVYIDKLLQFHIDNDYDFTESEGLPFGVFAYALNTEAIRKACDLKSAVDTEVWGGYFTETSKFKCGTMRVTDQEVVWPELRLTVDTAEDFELICKIFDALYVDKNIFPLQDIVGLCRENPDLPVINSHVVQKDGPAIQLKGTVANTV